MSIFSVANLKLEFIMTMFLQMLLNKEKVKIWLNSTISPVNIVLRNFYREWRSKIKQTEHKVRFYRRFVYFLFGKFLGIFSISEKPEMSKKSIATEINRNCFSFLQHSSLIRIFLSFFLFFFLSFLYLCLSCFIFNLSVSPLWVVWLT